VRSKCGSLADDGGGERRPNVDERAAAPGETGSRIADIRRELERELAGSTQKEDAFLPASVSAFNHPDLHLDILRAVFELNATAATAQLVSPGRARSAAAQTRRAVWKLVIALSTAARSNIQATLLYLPRSVATMTGGNAIVAIGFVMQAPRGGEGFGASSNHLTTTLLQLA
jgi:hypothetical protein